MKETHDVLFNFINSLEELKKQHKKLVELHSVQDLKLSDYYHIIENYTFNELDHEQLLKDMQDTLKLRREVKTLISVTGSAMDRVKINEEIIEGWSRTLEKGSIYGYRILEEEQLAKYIKEETK